MTVHPHDRNKTARRRICTKLETIVTKLQKLTEVEFEDLDKLDMEDLERMIGFLTDLKSNYDS